jgi:multidomain signaling protein FimX
MAKKDTVIRLLQVEDSLEDAEAITTALRNGAIAARPLRPDSEEALLEALAKQPVDLVVAS